MRYIRTKDGVYELISNLDNKNRMNVKAKTYFSYVLIAKSSIVAQDNTIEDLVDEYVFVDSIGSFVITIDWCDKQKVEKSTVEFECMSLSRPLKDCLKRGTIYGAIWTDKGLIYVAKMNEKGELELL